MPEDLIAALQSPACYPHPVQALRVLETHISWVVLTGPFAYKIKKPIDAGFLDFSTLEKRRFFCEEELRLNSRFSSGLYLEVVGIGGSPGKPRVGGGGEPFEYAVKMRQFDQEALLSHINGQHGLGDEDLRGLARKLAHFHLAVAARLPEGEPELGSLALVREVVLENFRQIGRVLEGEAARAGLTRLREQAEAQLARLAPSLEKRRAQGFVRECHGDLHLANIARLAGEIVFFDCIEFSPRYRWIDTMSELAFLLMDMERKGLKPQANRVLNLYLEHTGDYAGLAVLGFYKAYRAMVRAKVCMLRLAGGGLETGQAHAMQAEYRGYAGLAESCGKASFAFLLLTQGVSGSGKSTVAAELAGALDALRLRSDVERKRLFGLSPEAPSEAEHKTLLYTRAASDRTFDRLEATARAVLQLGYPVIVDATFITRDRRRPFQRLARELGVPFAILECRASEAEILRRLEKRAAKRAGASDADAAVMRSQQTHVEPFAPEETGQVLPIETEKPLNAQAVLDFLRERSGRG